MRISFLAARTEMTIGKGFGNTVLRATIGMQLTVAICGCSSQAELTIYSEPSGAYVTEVGSGTAIGIAPVLAVYPRFLVKQHQDLDGCFRLRGIQGMWVSGASAVQDPLRICGSPGGSYQIVLTRDPSASDLEKDLQFALQVDATRAQQQQAQAASDAALVAAYSAVRQQRPIECTSTASGDSVQTVCK